MNRASQLMRDLESGRTLIATVESCTGGLIASWITDVSGSSLGFWGSWVVYNEGAKAALGVPTQVIQKYGAVSREIAESLALQGVRKLSEAVGPTERRLAVVSTTGTAEPGTERRCYVGVASVRPGEQDFRAQVIQVDAPPDMSRIECKELFATRAIEHLLKYLRLS